MIVRRTGILIVCYAIASMLLYFADVNFTILLWVDMWGPVLGWILRVAILAFGFWLVSKSDDWDE